MDELASVGAAGTKSHRDQASCLFARTDRAGQTAVIVAVIPVPERLARFDPAAEHFNFLRRTSRRIGRLEVLIAFGSEVFIMTILNDGLEYVANFVHVPSLLLSMRRATDEIAIRQGGFTFPANAANAVGSQAASDLVGSFPGYTASAAELGWVAVATIDRR